jgi:hypothetical protein
MITLEQVAGWAAVVAAVSTVIGAVFLGLFFSRGQPWGTLNDVASIVLMIATMPVALIVARIESGREPTLAVVIAAIGMAGMIVASIAQALLVARIRTYQQLLPWTLGGGAVVGVWYVLLGVVAWSGSLPQPLPSLAIVSGMGFIAIGYGFTVGNERHPASFVGGIVLLLASTAFLAWLGFTLLSEGIVEGTAWSG